MSISQQIAKHLREVHSGGNWTTSNLRAHLSEVSWEQAVHKTEGFNTIAALAFHINYYVAAILKVMQGGPLDAHDRYSYDVPNITSQKEWETLLEKMWREAEQLAACIEQFPDSRLQENFTDVKYGNYYRNFHGLIEHTHYHLGQIVMIKKML